MIINHSFIKMYLIVRKEKKNYKFANNRFFSFSQDITISLLFLFPHSIR